MCKIVFYTYMALFPVATFGSFLGFLWILVKSCNPYTIGEQSLPGSLTCSIYSGRSRTLIAHRFRDCARIGWGLWIAIPFLVCVGLKRVWGMHPEFARIAVEWTVMTDLHDRGGRLVPRLVQSPEYCSVCSVNGCRDYGYCRGITCSFVGWGGRGSLWSISARFCLHCLLRPTPGLFYIPRQVSYFNCGRILWLCEDCCDCGTL